MAIFPSDIELLTVEEFARRFRVGRSTVFHWIATKKMLPGVHYFRIGKTVRIPWSMELLSSLSTVSDDKNDSKPVRSGRGRVMVNLEY